MHTALEPTPYRWGDYHRFTFSLGLDVGPRLVLSGHTASRVDPGTRRVVLPEGLIAQAHDIYDKIDVILSAGGAKLSDVTHVVEYVTASAADDHDVVEAVRRERLGGADPVVTTLCINRLLRADALLEVAVVAGAGRPLPRGTPSASVHLPSIHVNDAEAGRPFDEQVEIVLDRAEEALAAAGYRWADVAFAMEHVSEEVGPQPIRTALDRTDRLGDRQMAGARVMTRRLVPTGALTQLDLTVAHSPIEVVTAEASLNTPAALADAVRAGDCVYLSAQTGAARASRQSRATEMSAQADRAYGRLLDLLAAAGVAPEDLVETVEYVTEDALEGYAQTAAVRRTHLPTPYTAATGTICSALDDPGAGFAVYGLALLRGGSHASQ